MDRSEELARLRGATELRKVRSDVMVQKPKPPPMTIVLTGGWTSRIVEPGDRD
jgi:hypothetical protein